MITASAFRGKRYGVYGLARSGLSTVAALAASGADVVAWDDKPAARGNVAVPLVDLNTADLAGLDALVVSPGVPLRTHPLTQRAAAAGIKVIGDIELFAQARPELPAHKVVGITGTNGKSTTTALIHHILDAAGVPARLGGNIGMPILSADPLPAGGVYVLELSSYQLDLTFSLDCDVAVLLNITPDHLDRHGDMAGYAAAKARLFGMQSSQNVAVIATEDAYTRAIARSVHGKLVPVSTADISDQSAWPALQGPHNAQNAAAAIAVARTLGLDDARIATGLATYPGLPHRMENVRTLNGVRFVNDSKATNPTSTAPALAAFPRSHWIAGGQPKGDDLDALMPHLAHVAAVYLIGEAAPLFGRLLGTSVPVVHSGTLDNAVRAAATAAKPGEVVLLSPACASFDQFSDFEARGRAFAAIVESL